MSSFSNSSPGYAYGNSDYWNAPPNGQAAIIDSSTLAFIRFDATGLLAALESANWATLEATLTLSFVMPPSDNAAWKAAGDESLNAALPNDYNDASTRLLTGDTTDIPLAFGASSVDIDVKAILIDMVGYDASRDYLSFRLWQPSGSGVGAYFTASIVVNYEAAPSGPEATVDDVECTATVEAMTAELQVSVDLADITSSATVEALTAGPVVLATLDDITGNATVEAMTADASVTVDLDDITGNATVEAITAGPVILATLADITNSATVESLDAHTGLLVTMSDITATASVERIRIPAEWQVLGVSVGQVLKVGA